MHPKNSLKQKLLIVVFIGAIIISPVFISYFISKSINFSAKNQVQSGSILPIANASSITKQNKLVSARSLIRLRIPVIKIDAGVESVGLTFDGTMDVPKSLDNVGLFKLGPLPGKKGSAVIAGHYGWWKNGTQGVFNNLNKLRKEDKLYFEDEKGKTTIFAVREIKSYDPNADASKVFDSNDGKSHLNLITCEGVWDKVSKSYSKRLVIFTDKKESQ